MPIDLGSPIFEVALGLAFIFFLFSLVISSAVEGIAKIFQVRESKLEEGVELMLGDESLARAVIDHPLFKADVTGKRSITGRKKYRPAYVSARNFALALTRILRRRGADDNKVEAIAQVEAGAGSCEPHAKDQLEGLLEETDGKGEKRLEAFRSAVERWYDDGMDRVSGWYRGWTQVWTCVLAFAIAVGLNVDTIRVAERIGDDTSLRTAVVEQARATADNGFGQGEEAKTPTEAGENTAKALGKVSALDLPILWGEGNDHVDGTTLIGWLITFLALSLGAPFWFDALSRLAHLKTTGKQPEPAK